MLDGLMLKMALPANIEINSVVFGLPRVGNEAFANMVDKLVRRLSLHRSLKFCALIILPAPKPHSCDKPEGPCPSPPPKTPQVSAPFR